MKYDSNKNISQNSNVNVTVIFPAKNEEGTIETAISTAKQSQFEPEILVVDAYSTDKTAELATKAGAKVIQQPTQIFPGKIWEGCWITLAPALVANSAVLSVE